MSETIGDKKVFSLLEVTRSIQSVLAQRYTSVFWVKAEMIRLNHYPHSGHCYPDLVEKKAGKVIAQFRATLWRNDYLRIDREFQAVLKEPLKDGIKILLAAKIHFDPVYGLSLQIADIDPGYTLGDLEREKQETISRLKAAGLFDQNKLLPRPLLPQRIAVISVETSKGYADFRKVIENNAWGYRFFHLLFPALLQGERAVDSIITQLQRVRKVTPHFDAVAIIRGGGGDIGLSCYNNYRLSKEIALFPLPVITGIGHATNETVVEMIAAQNAITPTRMAESLVQAFHDFAVPVRQAEEKIADKAQRLILEKKAAFRAAVKYFRSVARNRLIRDSHAIRRQNASLAGQSRFLLRKARESHAVSLTALRKGAASAYTTPEKELRLSAAGMAKETSLFCRQQAALLDNIQKNIRNMDPEHVLKRGYSITLVNNTVITSPGEAGTGDVITTRLSGGRLTSKVISAQKKENHE